MVSNYGHGWTEAKKDTRDKAINFLKENKEINTADWIEFFNIEKEFADAVLGADE